MERCSWFVVFFGAGVTGALAASAVYAEPIVSGANGAALALLRAWAVPDLVAARGGQYYEGDLLGAARSPRVLLATPSRVRRRAGWRAWRVRSPAWSWVRHAADRTIRAVSARYRPRRAPWTAAHRRRAALL